MVRSLSRHVVLVGLTAAALIAALGQDADTMRRSKLRVVSSASSPTDISGLVLWLKPESLSGSNGDQISAWTDSSGNAYTVEQTTAGDRPILTNNVIGTFEAAYFDTNDRLVVSSSGALDCARNKTGHTVFIVGQRVTAVSGAYAYWLSTDTAANNRATLQFNATTTYRANARRLDADATFNSDSADAGAWDTPVAFCGRWDWANSDFHAWTNSVAAIADTTFGTDGSTSDTASAAFQIGGRSTYFDGWMCEVIVYNSALSASDRQHVESYLRSKYGLW